MSFDVEKARRDGEVVFNGRKHRLHCIDEKAGKVVFFMKDGLGSSLTDNVFLSNLPAEPPEHPILKMFDEAVANVRSKGAPFNCNDVRAALAERIEADPIEDVRRYGCSVVSLGPAQHFLVCNGKAMVHFASGYEWVPVQTVVAMQYVGDRLSVESAARAALANPPQQEAK